MLKPNHERDIRYLMTELIDQIAATQSALNEGNLTPADVVDLWRVVDYSQFKLAGIMYGARIDIEGEYMDDTD